MRPKFVFFSHGVQYKNLTFVNLNFLVFFPSWGKGKGGIDPLPLENVRMFLV